MNALGDTPRAASPSLLAPGGSNLVFLLGAPRSGTTWLAKIFDSHPQVLYRHEPDSVSRNDRLPYLCPPGEVETYRDEARRYVSELMTLRVLKSAGSLPLFPKAYSGFLAQQARAGLVYSLHIADALSRGRGWFRRISIPDWIDRKPGFNPTIVFKSVGSRGRARLFGEALPKSRIIFILRHPCGQVASTIRGVSAGKFENVDTLRPLLVTEEAKALELTPARAATFTQIEEYAWHWAVLNQKALNDLAALRGDRVKLVRYEDLCADPERVARELFSFAGLSWSDQTAAFIRRSTAGGDMERFYGTSRDSLQAANRWRTTLSREDQQRILKIAARVPAGAIFAAQD